MPNLNKVILMGHLGKDPQITTAKNKNKVANITLATSEEWKDKNGETHQDTEWHRIVFFGKLAEIAEDYLIKGAAVYVEGKLKTEKYTDKDGIERYVTCIIGNNFQIISSKNKADKQQNKGSTQTNHTNNMDDDDIPY